MRRVEAWAALAILTGWPAQAWAQAGATHWSAVYAGPIYLIGALLLLAIGRALDAPGWNRFGVVLWLLLMAAGGCLAIYALPGIVHGKYWQLPVLIATFLVFIGIGQDALTRLQRD